MVTYREYLLRAVLRVEPPELPPIDVYNRSIATARRSRKFQRDGYINIGRQAKIEGCTVGTDACS